MRSVEFVTGVLVCEAYRLMKCWRKFYRKIGKNIVGREGRKK
jgi:hypothetical protein